MMYNFPFSCAALNFPVCVCVCARVCALPGHSFHKYLSSACSMPALDEVQNVVMGEEILIS